MADQAREFNLNATDWTARDTAWIPAVYDVWYFHSHPDYDGVVYVIGDGTNVTGSLDIYADPWQYKITEFSLSNGSTVFPMSNIRGYKASSDDYLIFDVVTSKKPLQTATTLTITAPSSSLEFIDPISGTRTTLGTHTITSIVIRDDGFKFQLNQTGVATSMTSFRQCYVTANGTGGKITLS